ncbi:MAG: SDR family NAD(P)-dependent oxidoreductase, partial [Candidatus Omnitrophica bacterium]|nr:SDR family NAD(P)-dependent oxidoreductase [Candidatus Omnitrophota bacterium]
VLVTGGAGFIGSHLVAALVKAGHEVTVLDNLSSAKVLSVNRLQKVRDKVEYIQDDIRNFEVVKKLTEGKDVIFHLAAQSDVQMSIKDPAYDAQVNIFGTLNILRGAQMGKAKRFSNQGIRPVYGARAFRQGIP